MAMPIFAQRLVCLFCLLAASPWATAAEAEAAKPRWDTLGGIMDAGGVTMYGILALSLFAVFLAVFFVLTIRSRVIFPRPFMADLERVAGEGDTESMKLLCRESDCVAAKVVLAGLEETEEGALPDRQALESGMEEEGGRQATLLWQRVHWLLDVAVIAPMVGLLGTVLGMLQAFGSMETQIGGVIPLSLAAGLAKAMITTVGGLVVGIPAMLLYAYFRGGVTACMLDMEKGCRRVVRILCRASKRRKTGG